MSPALSSAEQRRFQNEVGIPVSLCLFRRRCLCSTYIRGLCCRSFVPAPSRNPVRLRTSAFPLGSLLRATPSEVSYDPLPLTLARTRSAQTQRQALLCEELSSLTPLHEFFRQQQADPSRANRVCPWREWHPRPVQQKGMEREEFARHAGR